MSVAPSPASFIEMPLIASLNAVSPDGWRDYAKQLASTGVDGLELNAYAVAADAKRKGADIDELKISEIFVNEGLTMKRIRPRAKGRADRIFKRSSHVTVTVTDE